MSLSIILTVGIILSIAFHFVGVYAEAKKTVWIMIVLMWAGSINIAMSEIKPVGYEDIKKMKGQFADTDQLIEEAGDEVSVYEMLGIKKSYQINNPKK
ncbi:hypothetical protein SMGD1_1438 [Sulfurimonas gotlandica GD1]|uniref:Uncharacterized protein n=1 Tax=Sulfurimonas gotlandica (strain DSM 19862 / JCM 16533 / GD1) TaxID=929558 RepID=H1FT43_SULGG|nr:hypothetical protein [Sulfurimonas gotlandica]EHP29962.1 hypothetical protein SMGD1_1438 [Sulfurimonas gotlandica GD1]